MSAIAATPNRSRWLRRQAWLWQPVHGRGYNERLFRARADPYGLGSSADQRFKYDVMLRSLGTRTFGTSLEMGCADGSFTEMLAARSLELLAVDVSAAAVDRVRDRLSHLPQVRAEVRLLPLEMPPGQFDLIVCSDVLYYWAPEVLLDALPRLECMLAPGGVLLAMHSLFDFASPVSGARVHELLRRGLSVEHVVGETLSDVGPGDAGFRLDIFRKAS
jgi:cyclopropane fatty-acyl-phospholipid synthase-like methyltransferase